MAELIDGVYLNKYLAPQLLKEFKNYKDDFVGLLGKPNKAALSADGIRFNKLINNVINKGNLTNTNFIYFKSNLEPI